MQAIFKLYIVHTTCTQHNGIQIGHELYAAWKQRKWIVWCTESTSARLKTHIYKFRICKHKLLCVCSKARSQNINSCLGAISHKSLLRSSRVFLVGFRLASSDFFKGFCDKRWRKREKDARIKLKGNKRCGKHGPVHII